jgi:hypothetical protein
MYKYAFKWDLKITLHSLQYCFSLYFAKYFYFSHSCIFDLVKTPKFLKVNILGSVDYINVKFLLKLIAPS